MAAIGDFGSNVGQYGYTIRFHHTSVEGANALMELRAALRAMAQEDLDVLVIVRGSGRKACKPLTMRLSFV